MRGILFDKDGTLIDFHASWSRLFRELCLELAEGDRGRADDMLVKGGMDLATGHCRAGSIFAAGNTIDIATLWYPELAGEELSAMIRRMDAAFHKNGVLYSVPLPGLSDTLEALAGMRVAMGVATSDGTAATRAALAALKVDRYLPHVFGYDSVARPKPAPDMVHAFAAAIGAPAAEVAVVGDNTHDLHMARSAGAGAAIGVLSGTGKAEDLAPLADHVLDSIADLPAWLTSRRAR
jgi:phosphoglycolate phosphatase